jgi:hypothetical protein
MLKVLPLLSMWVNTEATEAKFLGKSLKNHNPAEN